MGLRCCTLPPLGALTRGGRAAVGPLIEGLDEGTVAVLCEAMAGAFVGSAQEDAGPQKDYLINCENIILAFAGRTLLSRCDLKIERGHRYGLVGQNGV